MPKVISAPDLLSYSFFAQTALKSKWLQGGITRLLSHPSVVVRNERSIYLQSNAFLIAERFAYRGIMDLVDANEGPAESDHPLNTSPERPALNGAGGGPGSSGHNHSQSSAISIVQVTLPQAQVSIAHAHTHILLIC